LDLGNFEIAVDFFPAVQVCDATGDAMKNLSPAHKNSSYKIKSPG
jgi:hypothetical protein